MLRQQNEQNMRFTNQGGQGTRRIEQNNIKSTEYAGSRQAVATNPNQTAMTPQLYAQSNKPKIGTIPTTMNNTFVLGNVPINNSMMAPNPSTQQSLNQ